MKANYHTHTYRCMHASGLDEEYVLAAIENGFDELGFADHCPWRYNSNFVSPIRMTVEQFAGYRDSVLSLKEKYADQISIKFGLEVEYFPDYMDWMRGLADGAGLDYMIFANHYAISDEVCPYFGNWVDLDIYLKSQLAGMECDDFCYVAHPDTYMKPYNCVFDSEAERVAEAICKRAKELDRLLEFNLLGLRRGDMLGRDFGYPCKQFWQIAAAHGCRVIIGTDAHAPGQLYDQKYREYAETFLTELGMKIETTFPMRR